MANTMFTPGPWEVSYGNKGSIFGDLHNSKHNGDYPYIGNVDGITPSNSQPEAVANAALIAAAPEMFDKLRKASKLLDQKGYSMFAGEINLLLSRVVVAEECDATDDAMKNKPMGK